jgi:hypothetical protein
VDHVANHVGIGEHDLADPGVMPWADNNTICARRHGTTDPDVRRTIRSSRLPSSLVISRNATLAVT